jgi:hypothetical protein
VRAEVNHDTISDLACLADFLVCELDIHRIGSFVVTDLHGYLYSISSITVTILPSISSTTTIMDFTSPCGVVMGLLDNNAD